ncbi:hypothetical protein K1719_029764 [Acacia pycnantha]|nr:hypothetical protein K1719_029764 [Acacia pycnantha]
MNIMIWNSRGAASKGVAAVVRDMRYRYKLDMLVILEPRISGNAANKVIKSWGFRHSYRREAVGFSGGLWIIWDREELVVDVRVTDEQFLHCKLCLEGNEMLFTAVYANPNEQRRIRLWSMLSQIANEVDEPWILAGDFNEIKTPLEQKGGGRVSERRCRQFSDWIQECHLLDLDASGPFFTWKGPKWEGLDRVYKRLDRCLCNVSWQEKFEVTRSKLYHGSARITIQSVVLNGKYGRKKDLKREWKVVSSDSELWRSLADVAPKVCQNMAWEVGNGENVKFWYDSWLEGGKSGEAALG